MKICFVTCLIPQVLGSPVSGAYCWRWHDDVMSFILSHSPVGLYFEDHFFNNLILWYIAEKQVEHVLMSFSVVATTTTSWSAKWDFENYLKCGREESSMLFSRGTFKRGDYSPLTPCASRYRGKKFAKIQFSLKWPCVCEISESFVGLTHPFLLSLLVS